jgi:hypothetical protein
MHGVELVPSIMVMDNCVLGLSKMLTDRLWCIEQFCQLKQMRLLNCNGFLIWVLSDGSQSNFNQWKWLKVKCFWLVPCIIHGVDHAFTMPIYVAMWNDTYDN